MEILLSDTMGYCGGVSRAISMVDLAIQDAHEKGVPVYSLGKVIHNKQVCLAFEQQGLVTISSPLGHEPGLVVLRAHGVPDALRRQFSEAGFTLIDATCPVVSRNLRLIAANQGSATIVIVGHENHPETLAMLGVEGDCTGCEAVVISHPEDIAKLEKGKAYAVFIQTTFDRILWQEIRSKLLEEIEQGYDIRFCNEVCPSSVSRRDAALRLAHRCDAILVIGGKESANTKALYSLVVQQGKPAWHIESAEEILPEMRGYGILGVTAGASTPPATIEEVLEILKEV
ncbi:4-hydroxy-3-methylbut-2-enyl diphosphate reductase [Sphaerochaeta sp. PS]|uniref:4-hydroxy-3-methylbut-2-enyl diphosphate reductase n=1 Tax=Sphaerochaeta sp. PS TaxID=3076336 RepID=UPI0028A4478A|nr:4-hydroxy-3-methylbut-2-enyl diphosphate reductase [Sphaerochaeta sp. PS]MDT4762666.1 4-hydroxy-3-methylbut-2-enyl diphosphate reductase [Sphaerochaeta sp. PS]